MPILPLGSLCFCGSGKAYGECHFNKRYSNQNQLFVELGKSQSNGSSCLAIGKTGFCGKKTIRSHSIQRGRTLAAIAQDHKVYAFPTSPHGSLVGHKEDEFKPVWIKAASTFSGFCREHDIELFSSIENQGLKNNYDSARKTAYRAHCYETLSHTNAAAISKFFEEDAILDFQCNLDFTKPETANMVHYARYCWALKETFEKVLKRASMRKFYFFSVLFDKMLPFASTGSFCIETDFNGERAQDFRSVGGKFNYAQIWIIPLKDGGTYAGISGINDRNPKALIQLLQSLKGQEPKKLANLFLKLAVVHSENTFFSPAYIQELKTDQQQFLLDYFSETTLGMVSQIRLADSLSREIPLSLKANPISIFSNFR